MSIDQKLVGGHQVAATPALERETQQTPAALALTCLIDCFAAAGYDRSGSYTAVLRSQHAEGFGELCSTLENIVASRKGWGLAHWAADVGLSGTLALLAELGEDLGARDAEGITPAHIAAAAGRPDVLRELTRTCTDSALLDAGDDDGGTPAHHAAGADAPTSLRALEELGADLNACDRWAGGPVHAAAANGAIAALRCLGELGRDLEALDSTGQRPAHWAAEAGQAQALRTLWDLGADVHARDFDSLTPADVAKENGHVGVARLLLEELSPQDGPELS